MTVKCYNAMSLGCAVTTIVISHGGINATARATGVDKAFISRLLRGKKMAPSDETLRKLGLEAIRTETMYIVSHQRLKKNGE